LALPILSIELRSSDHTKRRERERERERYVIDSIDAEAWISSVRLEGRKKRGKEKTEFLNGERVISRRDPEERLRLLSRQCISMKRSSAS
jgi:hypothetical protein